MPQTESRKNNKNCTQEMCFIYVFIVRNLQLHREGLQLHKEGMQLHRGKPSIKPRRNKSKSLKSMFFWGARKFKCLVLISANLFQLMFLFCHLYFLLVDNSCDNVCGEFLIFFLMDISKDLDGILKNLWWIFEDLLKKLMKTLLHFSYPLDPVLWLQAFKNLPLKFEEI